MVRNSDIALTSLTFDYVEVILCLIEFSWLYQLTPYRKDGHITEPIISRILRTWSPGKYFERSTVGQSAGLQFAHTKIESRTKHMADSFSVEAPELNSMHIWKALPSH